ncbi:MAG: hypothetical protein ACK4YO_01960 [Candidatus Altarchaeaceae archaeon]
MAEIKCECGGTFKPATENVDGTEVNCMKCDKCGKVLYTSEQMQELLEAKSLIKKTTTKRKVIVLGKSFAITLPKSLEKIGLRAGQMVSMRMVRKRTLEVTIPEEPETEKNKEKNNEK